LNPIDDATAAAAPVPAAQHDHTTPAAAEAAFQEHCAHAHALLVGLGPANALRVIGGIAGGMATKTRAEAPSVDGSVAREWSEWSRRIEQLVTAEQPAPASDSSSSAAFAADTFGETTGRDEDEEPAQDEGTEDDDEEEAAPRPRRERSRMRRLVAGMFDVSGQVETCRLREVNVMGSLGEVIGIANEQGIEETEWPIAAMTPELLRRLTPRGGKYRFEWFGRAEDGARVGRGRSRMFKIQGDRVKKLKKKRDAGASPAVTVAPAASSVQTGGLEQLLVFQRFLDEREERDRTRQAEIEKHREELASRERIEKMRADVELAKVKAATPTPDGELSPATIAAYVNQQIDARYEDEDEEDADDLGLPKWLQALGVNAQTLQVIGPMVFQHLQGLIPGLAGNGLAGAPYPSAPSGGPFPSAPPQRPTPEGT
jgi:hypothetical protein